MKFKHIIFFFTFVFISGTNFLNISIANASDIEDSTFSLDINYLDRVPKGDYILGPGDKLKIVISRLYPELDTTSIIDGDGTIYLPNINRIYIEGLTINELNILLNQKLDEFIRFPEAEVEIIEYRPIKVLVKGEVVNPGIKILEGSLSVSNKQDNSAFESLENNFENVDNNSYYFPTVFDAIRKSGGITLFSDLTKVKIIRNQILSEGGGKKTAFLNFEQALLTGDNSQNIRIYDSDVIIIEKNKNENIELLNKATLSNLNPRFINVFITGRVNRPGTQTLTKSSSLIDGIEMAGGVKVLKGKIKFIRFQNDGSIDSRLISYKKSAKRGSYNNPRLIDGDIIIAGENFITRSNEVINEITSPFVGIFSTYGLIKALQ